MVVIESIQEQKRVKTYQRRSPSYNLINFYSFRRLANHIVATLQMIEMDMKIDGTFDSPIVDIDVSTIKKHLDTEIVIAVTVKNEIPKLKEQEKANVFQGLDEAVTAAKNRDHILGVIATRTPFEYQELKAFFDHYKSYDVVLAAVDYCSANGLTSLRLPPIVDVVTCPNCQASVGVSRNVGYVQKAKEPA